MSGTAKTILIVGGAAVAVYAFWKFSASAPARAPAPTANPKGKIVSGLESLIPAGVSALKGLFSSPSPSAGSSFGGSASDANLAGAIGRGDYTFGTDSAAQQNYAISHDVVDVQGNQLIDENTGNALIYGTD